MLSEHNQSKDILYAKAKHDVLNERRGNAFIEKFPGQCEHILRLITERLHLGLDKRDGSDPAVPETWKLNASEIADLSEAMYYLNSVRQSLNVR
jgi:hypothetical protein